MKNFKLKLAAPALLALSCFASTQSFAWSTSCDVIGTPQDFWHMQHWVDVTLAESNAGYSGLFLRETLTHLPSPIWPYGPYWSPNQPNTAWGDGMNFHFDQSQIIYSWQLDGSATAADANEDELVNTRIECDPAYWG